MSKPIKVVLADGRIVWEIRVRENGKGSSQLKRRFPTSREAEDWKADLMAERKKIQLGHIEVGSFYDTTIEKEAINWLDDLKLRSSPGHFRRSKDIIEDFNKTYGNLEPNRITVEFLTGLQRILKKRPGKKPGSNLSNSSVNKFTEAICAVLNFSAEQKRIPFNPVAGFNKLPKTSPEMLFWDEKEAQSFLAHANKKYCELDNNSSRARKNYVAYLLALNTGMRAGEIWGLKPHDLYFNEDGLGDTIFVRRQYNASSGEFAPLKGGVNSSKDKSRHVPCGRELKEELESLIRFNKIRGDVTIFQSVLGNPFNHDSFADKFERDIKRWGGRKIRFHDLRHTAATLMLSKGIDVKTVSEILGHNDLATTMIYVHLLGERIKQVSRMFSILPAETTPRLQLVTNR